MTSPTHIRRRALEAELREIKRFEAEDRAASPKVVGTPGEGTERRAMYRNALDELLDRQRDRCADCNCTFDTKDWEVDHIVPLALGGSDAMSNLQALCPRCHKAKTREDIRRISKARRQAKMMQPREPSKRPLQSRNTFR